MLDQGALDISEISKTKLWISRCPIRSSVCLCKVEITPPKLYDLNKMAHYIKWRFENHDKSSHSLHFQTPWAQFKLLYSPKMIQFFMWNESWWCYDIISPPPFPCHGLSAGEKSSRSHTGHYRRHLLKYDSIRVTRLLIFARRGLMDRDSLCQGGCKNTTGFVVPPIMSAYLDKT